MYAKYNFITKRFMILHSPTENENDNACHLEQSERSFLGPCFKGPHDGHEVMRIFVAEAFTVFVASS